jgi:nonribosomal peptide synthetase DhbF
LPSVHGLQDAVSAMVEKLKPFQELGLAVSGAAGGGADAAADIERALLRREAEIACREIMADAVLPADIRPAASAGPPPVRRHALLTGATGYVGGFVLRELLRANTHVTCIVRAPDVPAATARVVANLTKMGIWESDLADRLEVVRGDLEQPRFGFTRDAYARLSDAIDSVFHCAAFVHYWMPYSQLHQSNVESTKHVVEFLCSGPAKVLHFVSSTTLFQSPLHPRHAVVREDHFPETPFGNVFGYGSSKWAAESLVRQLKARGAHVVVYRPGAIVGDSKHGYWSPRDLATMLTMHALANDAMADTGGVLQGIPVDVVARFIEACSNDPAGCGETFQLIHPHPVALDDAVDVLRRRGLPVRRTSREEWIAGFLAQADAELVRPLFEVRGVGASAPIIECLLEIPTFDARGFHRQLDIYGIPCPAYERLVEGGWLDRLIGLSGRSMNTAAAQIE